MTRLRLTDHGYCGFCAEGPTVIWESDRPGFGICGGCLDHKAECGRSMQDVAEVQDPTPDDHPATRYP